jgi:hypothetical protein
MIQDRIYRLKYDLEVFKLSRRLTQINADNKIVSIHYSLFLISVHLRESAADLSITEYHPRKNH